MKAAAKLKVSQLSPLLNLNTEERRQVRMITITVKMIMILLTKPMLRVMILMMAMVQVMEWMDLERNAAILEKTDKAIAQKLRATSGGKVNVQTDLSSQVFQALKEEENVQWKICMKLYKT